jgi:hypothetical protein
MRFVKDALSKMAERDYFVNEFSHYTDHVLSQGRLIPILSKPRVIEAHGAWQNDIHRLGNHEKNLDEGLDHFKQAGHLAYWVRRMSPVVEATDTTTNIGDAPGYDISEGEREFRNLILGCCNEYIAFDIGFQLVKLHEIDPSKPASRAATLTLSLDYIQRVCHFMKYKHVSPHALHLIYSSLFSS